MSDDDFLIRSSKGEFILYTTDDGGSRMECRFEDETIWLSQALMAELFDRSKKTISEHLKNLFEEDELAENSVVRNFRTTASDGKSYEVQHYNLEAILAVGFRVRSEQGAQFRRWAIQILEGTTGEVRAIDVGEAREGKRSLAEREGFEPSVRLKTVRRFSKPLLSTTQPPLRSGPRASRFPPLGARKNPDFVCFAFEKPYLYRLVF